MSRSINNYDEHARSFSPQEKSPSQIVEAINQNNTQPEGTSAILWFYVHSFAEVYSSWGKLLYADLRDLYERLQEDLPSLTDEADWELTRFCVHSVITSMADFAAKRGYERAESVNNVREEARVLLTVPPADIRDQFGRIVSAVHEIRDDQIVLQVEAEMRQEALGRRTWRDAEQENLTKYLQKVEVFLSHAVVGQYPHVAACTALLHKSFGQGATVFLSQLFKEAQNHVRK